MSLFSTLITVAEAKLGLVISLIPVEVVLSICIAGFVKMIPICALPPALVPVTSPTDLENRVIEPTTSERPIVITSVGDGTTSHRTTAKDVPANPTKARQNSPASRGNLLDLKKVIRFSVD